MKRVLVTDRTAQIIKAMQNDDLMQWSCKKSEVADSFSELTRLLISARCEEGSELAGSVDGVVKVMETLTSYNDLLNDIADTSESVLPSYSLVFPENENECFIPSEADYKALRKIFQSHPEALKNVEADVDSLTLTEAAEMLDMSEKDLKLAIFKNKYNG